MRPMQQSNYAEKDQLFCFSSLPYLLTPLICKDAISIKPKPIL